MLCSGSQPQHLMSPLWSIAGVLLDYYYYYYSIIIIAAESLTPWQFGSPLSSPSSPSSPAARDTQLAGIQSQSELN